MFGRAIIHLCLPAICFSFALFPDDGHETQRRQNPEQNMANGFNEQGLVENCFRMIRQCFDAVRNSRTQSRRDPQSIVVDGRLAVQCESNVLKESRNCMDAASVCSDFDFYKASLRSLMSWHFICQNSEAFVAGASCWDTTRSLPMFSTCMSFNDICNAPTCIRRSLASMPSCSRQDSSLLSRMATTVTEEVYGC